MNMTEKNIQGKYERNNGFGAFCLGAIFAGTIGFMTLHGKIDVPTRDARLPVPRSNQSLVLHPDYSQGQVSLGYTLLTDMDYNGTWDCAEKVDAGFTPGDAQKKFYFKQGFGPSQSVEGVEMKLVDDTFFEVVER